MSTRRFFRRLMDYLAPESVPARKPTPTEAMEEYLDEHRSQQLGLDDKNEDKKVEVPVISFKF